LEPNPITVVVCDDHKVVAQGLAAVLEAESDIQVLGIAASVREVLELVERQSPDVALVDYELPDGDGVEATTKLKKIDRELKVVMLTSYTDDEVLLAAMEAGCAGYMTKHAGAQSLVSGVRLAAAGEMLVSGTLLHQLLPRLSKNESAPAYDLTGREHEVLELLADGWATTAIAERLFLSLNTVRNHVQAILAKLGVHSRLEAVSKAAREGIIRRT
jgi:DNA-binding NarL/FixJ family response regulator